MSDLIPVSKGADYLEVHLDALAEHQRLGWTQCAKHEDAANQGGEGDKLSVADIRAKLTELGVQFDPKAKKAELQALLTVGNEDGEGA